MEKANTNYTELQNWEHLESYTPYTYDASAHFNTERNI